VERWAPPIEADAKLLVEALRLSGFRKLTFAGGEPTLCPWLTEVAAHAKNIGFKTALVSNGSRMTDELIAALAPCLDWIALSISLSRKAFEERGGLYDW
jgi:radical S-adenosyl methionine domain-containing protein 2